MNNEREAFEAYMADRYKNTVDQRVCVNSNGDYMAWDMQVAWHVWQAAKAQAVPEGFVLVLVTPSDEFIDKLADVICNEFDTTISGSAHCAREAYKAMMEQSK